MTKRLTFSLKNHNKHFLLILSRGSKFSDCRKCRGVFSFGWVYSPLRAKELVWPLSFKCLEIYLVFEFISGCFLTGPKSGKATSDSRLFLGAKLCRNYKEVHKISIRHLLRYCKDGRHRGQTARTSLSLVTGIPVWFWDCTRRQALCRYKAKVKHLGRKSSKTVALVRIFFWYLVPVSQYFPIVKWGSFWRRFHQISVLEDELSMD